MTRTRLALLACTAASAFLVYACFEPGLADRQARLENAVAALRAEDSAFAAMPRLTVQHKTLVASYIPFFRGHGQATLLHDIGSTIRRRGVDLQTSQAIHAATNGATTHVVITLRGTYVDLLLALCDLSNGDSILEVGNPSLRRDGNAVLATVPADLYEPARAGSSTQ